jgi:hypothetical protein
MTFSLNVRFNGCAINLLVSRDKKAFAQAIHNKLVGVLGSDATAYLTVTKYLCQGRCPSVPCGSSEELRNPVIDSAILDALEKQLFFSIRELAKLTCMGITTVHWQLTRSLGFVVKHLCWVPHNLMGLTELNISLCRTSYWASSLESNIRVGRSLSLLMSRGSVLP